MWKSWLCKHKQLENSLVDTGCGERVFVWGTHSRSRVSCILDSAESPMKSYDVTLVYDLVSCAKYCTWRRLCCVQSETLMFSVALWLFIVSVIHSMLRHKIHFELQFLTFSCVHKPPFYSRTT